MQVTLAEYFGLLTMYIVLAVLAVLFQVSFIGTTILLVVLPCLFLGWRLAPPWQLLAVIAVFAIGSTLVLEAVAASNGLWLPVTTWPWQILGVVPVELFVWSFAFNVFVLLQYEYFVDDRWLEAPRNDRHFRWLIFFSVSSLLLGILIATVLQGVVITYAFGWLLTAAVATLFLAMWLSHSASRRIGVKALTGAGLLLPFFLVHELVALFNTHIVYANPSQYLYSLNLLGNDWPLEKLLFFIIVPVWLIFVYELYLDDGK